MSVGKLVGWLVAGGSVGLTVGLWDGTPVGYLLGEVEGSDVIGGSVGEFVGWVVTGDWVGCE